MNYYASIAFLADSFYGKTYLDNQITGFVSIDYLNSKKANGVDLSTHYYNKIETGNLLANKVSTTGDASISGNSDVSKVPNLQRHPTESDTIPLVITTTSSSGAGFIAKFVSTVRGCLFEYLTSASSTSRRLGILGGSNKFVIKTGSHGLTIKPTGDVSISGNLDVGAGASSSKTDPHSNQQGSTAVTEIHSQSPWANKIEFITTHPTPRSFIRAISIIRISDIRKQGLDLKRILILYFLTLCVLRFLREGLDLKI